MLGLAALVLFSAGAAAAWLVGPPRLLRAGRPEPVREADPAPPPAEPDRPQAAPREEKVERVREVPAAIPPVSLPPKSAAPVPNTPIPPQIDVVLFSLAATPVARWGRCLLPVLIRRTYLGERERQCRRQAGHLRGVLRGEYVVELGPNVLPLRFVYVPAGSFPMGYGKEEELRLVEEARNPLAAHNATPQQTVRVSEGFFILDREVTAGQIAALDPRRNRAGKADLPVRDISWKDAMAFAGAVRERTGEVVRLPTEIEWEYAARGPFERRFPWANPGQFLAWAGPEGRNEPRPHDPGGGDVSWWGVHDMAGNVREWCLDVYSDRLLKDLKEKPALRVHVPSRVVPVSAGKTPLPRTVRGGCYKDQRRTCEVPTRRSFGEDESDPAIGFRLVLIVAPAR